MTLRQLYRRIRALVTCRRIYTATFQPCYADLHAKLLTIDPCAAALFAKKYGIPTQDKKSD